MKNKKFLLVLFTFILCFSIQAEAIWFQTTSDEGNRKETFNVFNLDGDPLYLPKRSSTWRNNGAAGNSNEGTLSTKNYIGKLTIKDCKHRIKLTVSTSGRFVSDSDPTKYRDFCIAISPRCKLGNSDSGFFWDIENNSYIDEEARLPNTKATGTVSCIAEVTDGKTKVRYDNSGYTAALKSFWFDMVICMEPTTSEDYKHMVEGDDYYAYIDVSWECIDENCNNPAHSGSSTIILRGYYNTGNPNRDDYIISVSPSPEASNIDIINVINSGEPLTISALHVKSTPKRNSGYYNTADWNNLYVFLSSSDSYSTQGGNFVLTNKANPSKTIGYTITIYNEDGTTTGQTYDGTQYYRGTFQSQKEQYTNKLNLGEIQESRDRDNTSYYFVDFLGTARINILNGTAIKNDIEYYAGIYESTIYYHVVYDD